jgi:xylitol oxidase
VAVTNWAGNVTFTGRVHRPRTMEQLRELVAGSHRIRALGSGHSFSRIADSAGDLVSLAELPAEIGIQGGSVTVTAGVRYAQLAPRLHAQRRALANLGSLPHISIAGACATGTHGSGNGNGSLATAVRAMELLTASGDLVTVDRATADFAGMVVALGALGIVTRLSLDTVPAFDVSQLVYLDLPFSAFDVGVLGAAYSVSLFTTWTTQRFEQVWCKHLANEPQPPPWPGAVTADRALHPIAGMPAANCTQQLGRPGPWHERLPHFRARFTPSSGDELQSEYWLPRASLPQALAALDRVRRRIAPALLISEIRTVAADELWLSPGYGRDSATIHFTWIPDAAAVQRAMDAVEEQLAPFEPRPHWGKLFGGLGGQATGRYQRLPAFRRLMRRYDPAGKFSNAFTGDLLGHR